jgi:carbon catabolite-derepressing protein kinase
MLVVDPVKRITLPEIKKLSWFQLGLPKYLMMPDESDKWSSDGGSRTGGSRRGSRSRDDQEDVEENGEDGKIEIGREDEGEGAVEDREGAVQEAGTGAAVTNGEGDGNVMFDEHGKRREWMDNLGWVEQDVVDELCNRIAGLGPEDVWRTLRERRDGQLQIAYQLCRDNRKMDFGELYLRRIYASPARGE